MTLTGTGASRILAPLGRLGAFISSVIVAGLVGSFMHRLHTHGLHYGSKITYVIALSGLSIFFSLLLMFPFKFTFWAFPLDFAFFIMWMVAFGLLANLASSCGGSWYRFVWRFSWNANRCGAWRSLLAFSFLASMFWLANTLLGAYKTFTGNREHNDHDRHERGFGRSKRLSHGSSVTDPAMSQPRTSQPTSAGYAADNTTRNAPVGNTHATDTGNTGGNVNPAYQ
ncbi:hypothetical protein jhhlp_006631 [Lomentospora prolificans]|uniref:MARVEL domain-containing protein n=1 Tax=Lomentospora prolificans TaxID=41688 RepID=A0A2N3N6F2_9PEZI|nr:hypothetical protein jhhlp_006631 [Lomentospora prolificans]